MEDIFMEMKYLKYERKDNIGIITLNNPPTNAINTVMIKSFQELIPELDNDPQVRCVVIVSALEKIFMAGADISWLQDMHKDLNAIKDRGEKRTPENHLQKAFDRVNAMSKPVIACINGHAVGGGCELALASHYRIMASDQGKIGLTEINLGIIPGAGGTQRIVRVLGMSRALPLLLEGTRLTAQEAKEIGLIHAHYPKDKLFDECIKLAGRLAEQPPIAVASILRCVRDGGDAPLQRGLDIESEEVYKCIPSDDAQEGFKAFFEKRKPKFQGK
jgi:enoyl-CoA hydratase/carnithine racemase